MEMRYMTYKNEEGQKERFYPITHKDAIVGLSDVPEMSGREITIQGFPKCRGNIANTYKQFGMIQRTAQTRELKYLRRYGIAIISTA